MSAADRKMAQPYNQASPFSPARNMMMQDVPPISMGTINSSATLIQGGNTVISNQSQSKMAI